MLFLVLVVTMAAGFTGNVLPDDMLSGTSLMILNGVLLSIPFVGTWLATLIFGGGYPGDPIALFYPLHIVVLPLMLIGLVALGLVASGLRLPAASGGRRHFSAAAASSSSSSACSP